MNTIENPDKYAFQFMRKLALQFLMLAYKRSILFKTLASKLPLSEVNMGKVGETTAKHGK